MAMATGTATMIGTIMDPDGLTMVAMEMAITGTIMVPGGPITETTAIAMIGIVDPVGRIVGVMVLVGIRVMERMSPRGMATTLTPTSVTTRRMAGIHAPIIITGIRSSVRYFPTVRRGGRAAAGRRLDARPCVNKACNKPLNQ